MSLNPLAEAFMFGMANTEEAFLAVATLKPGKTWADVLEVMNERPIEGPFTCEAQVANMAKRLSEVVESTTLLDDGF